MLASESASIASPLAPSRRGRSATRVGHYLFLAAVANSSIGGGHGTLSIGAYAFRARSGPPHLDPENRNGLASNGWHPPASSKRQPTPPRSIDERDGGVRGGSSGGEDVVVRPPSSLSDYRGVGRLLAAADAGENEKDDDDGIASRVGITLNRVRSFVDARRYANEYVATARRMRGKKYSLLLAKTTATTGRSDGGGVNDGGEVVGMAEVGLSSYEFIVPASPPSFPPFTSLSAITSSSPAAEPLPPTSRDGVGVVASVGVLAVSLNHRRSGVGSSLLAASERAAALWGESALYAAVEASNDGALTFFGRMGYRPVTVTNASEDLDGDVVGGGGKGAAALVSVAVREGSITVRRPHLLLRKVLPGGKD